MGLSLANIDIENEMDYFEQLKKREGGDNRID